jgi:glycosyltransferase involved in cell wall biosynthesis
MTGEKMKVMPGTQSVPDSIPQEFVEVVAASDTDKSQPLFDVDFYRGWYLDLAAMSEVQAENHWLESGQAEGRFGIYQQLLESKGLDLGDLPSVFNWQEYLDINLDLPMPPEWNKYHAQVHYLESGFKEGRVCAMEQLLKKRKLRLKNLPADFDWEVFLLLNPELKKQKITTKTLAILHFLEFGALRSLDYLFDAKFYTGYHGLNIKNSSGKELLKHYDAIGRGAGFSPNFSSILKNHGFLGKHLPINFNYDVFIKLNPAHQTKNQWQALLMLMTQDSVHARPVSAIPSENFGFYKNLAAHYAATGQDSKAQQLYMIALRWGKDGQAVEHVGNILLRAGNFYQAKFWYLESVECPGHSVYAYLNGVKAMHQLHQDDQAMALAQAGVLKYASDNTTLEKLLIDTAHRLWASTSERCQVFTAFNQRDALVDTVQAVAQAQYRAFEKTLLRGSDEPVLLPIQRDGVLIVGDFHIPQCQRYRIDQKLEQLKHAGYEAAAVPWTDPAQAFKLLPWHDTVIFYRVPALPDVIRMIATARALGKLVIYEIDDLLFDPMYPPPIETYGSYVGIPEYRSLMQGMALLRAAAKLCDYAIASTQPLADALQGLVRSGKCFLHRNALDSQNLLPKKLPDPAKKGYVNLFYGSGTKAHNSDFMNEALPAIERILQEHPEVRLTIVGYLELPADFLAQYAKQVITIAPVKDVRAYWNYLSLSDINLAVLTPDPMTDCKSELKWFEAACFGVPSVVSATRNYLDVLHEGEDALMARTVEEWYLALKLLLTQPEKRRDMGLNARQRVLKDYSVAAMAIRLTQVLQEAADLHDGRAKALPMIELQTEGQQK